MVTGLKFQGKLISTPSPPVYTYKYLWKTVTNNTHRVLTMCSHCVEHLANFSSFDPYNTVTKQILPYLLVLLSGVVTLL
jgi:hypothetical protein